MGCAWDGPAPDPRAAESFAGPWCGTRYHRVRRVSGPLLLSACAIATSITLLACGSQASALPRPPAGLQAVVEPGAQSTAVADWPATGPSLGSGGPSLDMMVTKSMLYAAAVRHGLNPYLVMGLAWHESGWNPNAVSSAGAIGIMQVMPATASVDGPELLHRTVNLYDPADNIDMGAAILRNNLDHWNGDLAKALTAYYAGGRAVTDWADLREDCRRYVWAVYDDAVMFRDGRGPA